MKTIQRTFIPGSMWLSIKVYGGEKTLDNLLSKDIYLIIKELNSQKKINKWFFIRYADPDDHLRIRILMKNANIVGSVIDLFYKKLNLLVKERIIWKVIIDTYSRELERYGNSLIEDAETIFHIDSECIISCLRILNKFPNENYRWMISIRMIDELLSSFSLNVEQKKWLMSKLSWSYKEEFGFNEFNSKQFNSRYRLYKNILENVLKNKINDHVFNGLCVKVNRKSVMLRPVVSKVINKSRSKKNEIVLENLIMSYIHMMINRVFISQNRKHELIIYDFLRRYYTSEEVRIKNSSNDI